MFKKIIFSGVLSISLLSSGTGLAQPKFEGKQCSKNHKQCKFFKKLTADQRKQVKQIMQSHRGEFKPLRKQMHDLHKQLKAQYDSGKPSWDVIKPLMDEMNQLKAKKSLLRANLKLEIYNKTGVKLPPKRHHKRMMKHKKMPQQ